MTHIGYNISDKDDSIIINDDLLSQVMKVGGFDNKKEAITNVLNDYIRKRQLTDVTNLFGQIDYAEDYDYKTNRSRETS